MANKVKGSAKDLETTIEYVNKHLPHGTDDKDVVARIERLLELGLGLESNMGKDAVLVLMAREASGKVAEGNGYKNMMAMVGSEIACRASTFDPSLENMHGLLETATQRARFERIKTLDYATSRTRPVIDSFYPEDKPAEGGAEKPSATEAA